MTESAAVGASPEILHDAFISYSRKDSPFVATLERTLRNYRPPAGLDAPQRRLNIFRDTQDFTGTEYFESVERHLKASKKLIVVCSPSARLSPYVDDEIERFAEARGAGNIIPVIVAGIPNNEAKSPDDPQRAFPPALAERMKIPLACDYRGFETPADKWASAGKYEQAWFQLLANLLDRPRSEIDQREKLRQRQRLRLRLVVGGAVGALLLGAAVVALVQQQRAATANALAELQRATAESERLSGQSMQLADRDPIESLRLALAASTVRATEQATSALRLALARAPDMAILLHMPKRKDDEDFVSPPKFALAPDAKSIALAEAPARIVATDTGRARLAMKAGMAQAAEAKFSPNGELLGVVDEKHDSFIFDARTGEAKEKLTGELYWRPSTAQGSQALLLRERFLELGAIDRDGRWRAARKIKPEVYFNPKAGSGDFAQTVSPDGRKFATLVNSDNKGARLSVTDLDAGRTSTRMLSSQTGLAFSLKGALLAAFDVGGATIVDANSLKTMHQTPQGMIDGLSFSDDESLIALDARNDAVPVTSIRKRADIARLVGPNERVFGAAIAPANDSVAVKYAATNRVFVFALDGGLKGEEAETVSEPVANFDPIWGGAWDMRFLPDGRGLLIEYQRGVLALWAADRWRPRARLAIGYDPRYRAGAPEGLQDLRVTADAKAIGLFKDGAFKGRNIETGAKFEAEAPLKTLSAMELLEHGDFALMPDENDKTTVHLVQRATGARQYPLSHSAPVMSMGFSPNGQCVLTSSRFMSASGDMPPSSSVMRLWDTATGALLQE